MHPSPWGFTSFHVHFWCKEDAKPYLFRNVSRAPTPPHHSIPLHSFHYLCTCTYGARACASPPHRFTFFFFLMQVMKRMHLMHPTSPHRLTTSFFFSATFHVHLRNEMVWRRCTARVSYTLYVSLPLHLRCITISFSFHVHLRCKTGGNRGLSKPTVALGRTGGASCKEVKRCGEEDSETAEHKFPTLNTATPFPLSETYNVNDVFILVSLKMKCPGVHITTSSFFCKHSVLFYSSPHHFIPQGTGGYRSQPLH